VLKVREISREDAGNLIRAAHRADPGHRETARRLARYLFTTDALEELVGQFGPALSDPKADPECLHFLGLAASALGDRVLAESALSRAVSEGHAKSSGPWARALYDANRTSEAYSVGTRTLEQSPGDDWAAHVVFKILLAGRRHAELWDLCLRLRAAGSWTPRIVSALALAAQSPEQAALVRRITDRDTWVEYKALDLEPGWILEVSNSLKATNRWMPLPRVKATVGSGKRIEEVHTIAGNPLLDTLFGHIRTTVADYIGKRADLFASSVDDHPMAAMRPDHPTLASWVIAVNMEGHEDWHIHPDGWLSGVFYVEVPDLSVSEAPRAGQVEFGPFPLGPALDEAVWPRWTVQPRTGDLILFPSYFAHRTWPTHIGQVRICIAFDVLRRGIESPVVASAPGRARPSIGLDDRLVRDACAVSAPDAGGSQLFMNVDSGQCLAMDETGALLWTLLEAPRTAREITGILLREFEGNEAEIQKDIASALGLMVSCGLAVVA
jgi:Putative 2OG-Fe(II) oxygenase/Coenzyme PQQ synthesis protein D (PqqD)